MSRSRSHVRHLGVRQARSDQLRLAPLPRAADAVHRGAPPDFLASAHQPFGNRPFGFAIYPDFRNSGVAKMLTH